MEKTQCLRQSKKLDYSSEQGSFCSILLVCAPQTLKSWETISYHSRKKSFAQILILITVARTINTLRNFYRVVLAKYWPILEAIRYSRR